jgi:hypothetical protein
MLELIWESGKTIFSWVSEMKRNKKEINENVSNLLLEISNLLDDTSNKLESDQYPHDNCFQMKVLSENLTKSLKGKMDENKIIKLQQDLDISHRLEMLYAERKDPNIIKKLKECKGMYRALSQLIKM